MLTPTHFFLFFSTIFFFFNVPAQTARGRFVMIVNDMQNHANKHTSGGRDSCAAISYVEMATLRIASFSLRLPLGPFVYCAKALLFDYVNNKREMTGVCLQRNFTAAPPLCDKGGGWCCKRRRWWLITLHLSDVRWILYRRSAREARRAKKKPAWLWFDHTLGRH